MLTKTLTVWGNIKSCEKFGSFQRNSYLCSIGVEATPATVNRTNNF